MRRWRVIAILLLLVPLLVPVAALLVGLGAVDLFGRRLGCRIFHAALIALDAADEQFGDPFDELEEGRRGRRTQATGDVAPVGALSFSGVSGCANRVEKHFLELFLAIGRNQFDPMVSKTLDPDSDAVDRVLLQRLY